jgi:hypothetical protein
MRERCIVTKAVLLDYTVSVNAKLNVTYFCLLPRDDVHDMPLLVDEGRRFNSGPAIVSCFQVAS